MLSASNQALALPMNFRRLVLPSILLLLAVSFALVAQDVLSVFSTEELTVDRDDRDHISQLLIWFASAFLIIRLIDVVVLYGILERAIGSPPPQILSGLIALVIWISTLALALPFVFGQSTAGLLAASSVGLGVLGFSLSRVIADVFYSIALVFERPFEIGDWVKTSDGLEGQVKEVGWRKTTLIGIDDTSIAIPNSKIGGETLTNFNRPHVSFYRGLSFTLPYSVTAHRAERLLRSAIEEVPESANLPIKPAVSIKGLSPDGVEWLLYYGVPNYPAQWSVRTRLYRAILRNLFYANIDVAQPRMNVTMQRPASGNLDEDVGWLRRVALFGGLSDNEQTWLAGQTREHLWLAGQPVVEQGKPGSSLFVVKEGILDVTIKGEDGTTNEVGQVRAGHVFGEMSLLTGAPRGATVTPVVDAYVAEITKEDIEPIFRDHPELIEDIGAMLAERQSEASERLQRATTVSKNDESDALVDRIRNFFRL